MGVHPNLATGTHLEFTRPQKYLNEENYVISQNTRKNYCSVWQPFTNYSSLKDSKRAKPNAKKKDKAFAEAN